LGGAWNPIVTIRRKLAARGEAAFGALYVGIFLALGAQLAFYNVWLEQNGASEAAIGYINALALAARIIGGLALPTIARALGRPGAMIAAAGGIGACVCLAHLLASEIGVIAFLAVFATLCFVTILTLGEAHGYEMATILGFSYRKARSFGSFAFIVANLGVGAVVATFGIDSVPIWIALSLLLAGIGGACAPTIRIRKKRKTGSLVKILNNPRIMTLIVAAALIQASHAALYTYGSISWLEQGFSATLVGALWALGVAAEIGLFIAARRLFENNHPAQLMMIAGGIAAIRWLAMVAEPGLIPLLALQLLHAASFGLTHLAMMEHIQRTSPKGGAATAQGTATAITGVAFLIATSLAAEIYPSAGAAVFFSSTAFALCGVGVSLWSSFRPQSQRPPMPRH
jgi:PPP family 3-phenylpropionic acid transporter